MNAPDPITREKFAELLALKARMAAVDAHFSAKTPIHRPGAIEDFEGIGAYLASDASRYHSGDTIVIDGGSLIYPPYAF